MNKSYQYVLMDLDGTLTDPMLGITSCVEYALNHFGIRVDKLEDLCCFIGPPLLDSFQEYYGFTETQAQKAIVKYRERFATTGMYENVVYPGVEELLQKLHAAGKKMLLVTSKPEPFARQILEHFRLSGYFIFIGGATLDGVRSKKEDVIRYVLESSQITDSAGVVMVGDRKYDIEGAKVVGIDSIGVLYGYGSWEELKTAGPTEIVESVSQLGDILF